jgi:predicted signal transduction protein with EAL and GGDEF domain
MLGELIRGAPGASRTSLAGHEHHCSASIGMTLLHGQLSATTVDEVLKQADMAMYRAKDDGRNTLRFFDPDMQQAVNRRATAGDRTAQRSAALPVSAAVPGAG